MTSLPGKAPREERAVPGAFISLAAIALSELRRDVKLLIDSGWNESVRRRAEELASTLADAFRAQGLDGVAPYLRSTVNLTRLSKADAAPVMPALRDKLDHLLREIERRLPKRADRQLG